MSELRTHEEFEQYIRDRTLPELESIRYSLNRYMYPDRYSLLEELIQTRTAESEPKFSRALPDSWKVPVGIGALLIAYRVIITLQILGLALWPVSREMRSHFGILEGLLCLLIYVVLYFGISHAKHWVVIPVLVVSYLNLFYLLLELIYGPSPVSVGLEGIDAIFDRVSTLIAGMFFVFQVYLFSKPSVRAYFKESGTTLIV